MEGKEPIKKPAKAPKAKGGINVSNVAKLDAVHPIPFEYNGVAFSFIQGERYSPFMYPSDNFGQTLLECKLLSATHTACVETKKTYCAGRGLYDINEKEFDADVIKWLKRMNVKGESQAQINRKIFGSYFTFGNVPVELVRVSVGGKKKLFIYVHNFLEWRLGWPDENGNITTAIQSKLFLRQGIASADDIKNARQLPLYDPEKSDTDNWMPINGAERTMIWLKNDMDGYPTYGMPSSIGSLIYQINEYKAARHNLDDFDNNMVPGGIIGLKGNVSPDEATKVAREIIKAHSGDGKRGRWAAIASESGIDGYDLMPFDTKRDGSYVESDTKVMEKIIMANEWSSLLAGLQQAHSLGKGNTFLRTEYEIKKTTVIDPAQNFIVANLWQPVFEIAQKWMNGLYGTYELGILDIDPISALSDVDPTPALTVNEVREAVGMVALDDERGNKLMSELKPVPPAVSAQGGAGASV